jgi:hypothetical protein
MTDPGRDSPPGAATLCDTNQGDLSMPIETILMIVALIAAILVLAIGPPSSAVIQRSGSVA